MDSRIKDALKEIKATPRKGSFLLMEFGYHLKLILPYTEGIQLMASLENSRAIEGYGTDIKLLPTTRDKFQVTPFSAKEYEQLQVAELLNLTFKEVQKMYTSNETNPTP